MGSFEPQVPVNESVRRTVDKATKAIAATATTVTGVVALVGTMVADGVFTWGEGGTLIGAVVTAATTIWAVWRVPNDPKE